MSHADQVLAKAFEKFYRADMSDTAIRGLGLGLTITKGIIEAHGGSLRIESETGIGSRAIFRLPLPEHSSEAGAH